MIIEKLEALCSQNGTTLTALCKEITGSSGNLPTWKKDKIRPEWLKKICLKFNISSDFLLDLPNYKESMLTVDEQNTLLRFKRLNEDYQIKAQAYMIDLYEKQKNQQLLIKKIDERNKSTYNDSSVAADDPLKKTGTNDPKK